MYFNLTGFFASGKSPKSFYSGVYTSIYWCFFVERLVKNVDEKSWRILRAEAVKHGKPIGKFISVLVEEHVKRESSGSNWDVILRRKPFLTAAEAEAVKKAAGVFEQSYGFED